MRNLKVILKESETELMKSAKVNALAMQDSGKYMTFMNTVMTGIADYNKDFCPEVVREAVKFVSPKTKGCDCQKQINENLEKFLQTEEPKAENEAGIRRIMMQPKDDKIFNPDKDEKKTKE